MKKISFAVIVALVSLGLFTACPPKTLQAQFYLAPINPVVGTAVHFYDASYGKPTGWSWKFGDGVLAEGKTVTHTYSTTGSFPVSLTVSDLAGTQSAATKTIVVAPALVPNFTWTPSFAEAEVELQFTDVSTGIPTAWAWNFGDGSSAAIQNPKHTYMAGGTFTVTLTASNANGPKIITKSIVVAIALKVDFSWTPLLPVSGQEVQFTDKSTGVGIISWLWEFGDGTTSTLQNPKHIFTNTTGVNKDFVVTLTVTNSNGTTASMTIRP